MTSMLGIGVNGLMAFQLAMTVTSQNAANGLTPFYSRRRVDLTEMLTNNGVLVSDVYRIYSQVASQNLQDSTSNLSMSDVFGQQLIQLEKILNTDKANIGTALRDSLKSITDLNNNVSSPQGRADYLAKLDFLATQINFASSQISQQQDNINSSMQTIVSNVNSILSEISMINSQIAGSPGLDISGLLDERERQVQELAKYIDFSTEVDDNSIISISLNNGAPLILGEQAAAFNTAPDPTNPNQLIINFDPPIAVVPLNVTNAITGGQIAGLYKLQSSLSSTQNTLGRLALVMADGLNSQHKLGIDANGNWGRTRSAR